MRQRSKRALCLCAFEGSFFSFLLFFFFICFWVTSSLFPSPLQKLVVKAMVRASRSCLLQFFLPFFFFQAFLLTYPQRIGGLLREKKFTSRMLFKPPSCSFSFELVLSHCLNRKKTKIVFVHFGRNKKKKKTGVFKN